MWRIVAQSVRGTSHFESGLPCQDYSAYINTYIAEEKALIIGIADGAGSSKASDLGSKEAVEFILRCVSGWQQKIDKITEVDARRWVQETREHLESVAIENHLETRDLSCTLLVGILGEKNSVFFQIGDGAWIAEFEGNYQSVTWPLRGEYANETTFITSPMWSDRLQFAVWDQFSDGFAGFTDGVQAMALHYESESVHGPFFSPMFSALRNSEDETSLIVPLEEFLSSSHFNERTDDDKTLVIACRSQPMHLDELD